MFEARVAELETLARDQGLDFFPVSFEVVPQDIMTEVAAYRVAGKMMFMPSSA